MDSCGSQRAQQRALRLTLPDSAGTLAAFDTLRPGLSANLALVSAGSQRPQLKVEAGGALSSILSCRLLEGRQCRNSPALFVLAFTDAKKIMRGR